MTLSIRVPGTPLTAVQLEQSLAAAPGSGEPLLSWGRVKDAGARDVRSRERLPVATLRAVTPDHIRRAVEILSRDPTAHPFGASADFDLVTNSGVRLPPKAVFGLAASEALGFVVLPRHFTGGSGTPAFKALEAAGFLIEAKRVGGEEPPAADDQQIGTLAMMTDIATIDLAMNEWLDVLDDGARDEGGNRRWMPSEAIMFSARPSGRRDGAWDTELGANASGEPWTVQINAPTRAADANGLATVAVDRSGRRYLVRQGWLRRNPDSNGDVREPEFRASSGLTPVAVTGGATPTARDWYLVAALNDLPEDIRRQTADFVHACARARLRSLGVNVPRIAPPLTGADEKGGTFTWRAKDAQPEREVRRLQGEVWRSLKSILEAREVRFYKLRHSAGYEVDGVILASAGPILLEIKTGTSASDVYEGVGQLMLYAEMLGLSDHARILLLPSPPSETLMAAANSCGLAVHDYELDATDDAVSVKFSDAFLVACGVGD